MDEHATASRPDVEVPDRHRQEPHLSLPYSLTLLLELGIYLFLLSMFELVATGG